MATVQCCGEKEVSRKRRGCLSWLGIEGYEGLIERENSVDVYRKKHRVFMYYTVYSIHLPSQRPSFERKVTIGCVRFIAWDRGFFMFLLPLVPLKIFNECWVLWLKTWKVNGLRRQSANEKPSSFFRWPRGSTRMICIRGNYPIYKFIYWFASRSFIIIDP